MTKKIPFKSKSNAGAQPRNIGLTIGLTFRERPDNDNPMPVQPEWAISLACQSYPQNCSTVICSRKGREVGVARNELAEMCLKSGSKYLWFIDDDVAVPFYAARKLIYDLEQSPKDVMAVGGIYCVKQLPPEPVVYRGDGLGAFWDWKKGDVFEVSGIGTGCLMVKCEVFSKIEGPWFVTEDRSPDHAVEDNLIVDKDTDDLYFCRKVTQAGYKILADGGVICVHWDVETGTPYMLSDDTYPMREEAQQAK